MLLGSSPPIPHPVMFPHTHGQDPDSTSPPSPQICPRQSEPTVSGSSPIKGALSINNSILTLHETMEEELEGFFTPIATRKDNIENHSTQHVETTDPGTVISHSKVDTRPTITTKTVCTNDGHIYIDNSQAGEKALVPFLGQATVTKEPDPQKDQGKTITSKEHTPLFSSPDNTKKKIRRRRGVRGGQKRKNRPPVEDKDEMSVKIFNLSKKALNPYEISLLKRASHSAHPTTLTLLNCSLISTALPENSR